jgi:protein-tyrosine phosphatase
MIPSGDDGAATLDEAFELCREAAGRGTRVVYGTPHVNDELPLTHEREREVRRGAEQLSIALAPHGIEVRAGFELHPTRAHRREDPSRYKLDATAAVLVECPLHEFSRLALEDAVLLAEHVESCGLLPVLAHPERSREIAADPRRAESLSSRGWLLQVTGASLLGTYGPAVEAAAWQLLEAGYAQIVSSDGHGRRRPPFLDRAFDAAAARFGIERAQPLFSAQAVLELPVER